MIGVMQMSSSLARQANLRLDEEGSLDLSLFGTDDNDSTPLCRGQEGFGSR